jgi:hypothetical protein
VAGHGPVGGLGNRDWLTTGLLRVELTDSGGGTLVARPLPDAASLHGRGLFIVGKLSDAWGNQVTTGPHNERRVHSHSQSRCGLSSLSASEYRSTAPSYSTGAASPRTAYRPHESSPNQSGRHPWPWPNDSDDRA